MEEYFEELRRRGLLGERELKMASAQQLGMAFADLARVQIGNNAVLCVNRELATKFNAMPVKLDMGTLYVAVSEQPDNAMIEAFKLRTGLRIVPVLAVEKEIVATIDRYYPEG